MAELPRLLLCTFDVVPSGSAMSRRLYEYLAALEDRFQITGLSIKTADLPHIEKIKGARMLRVPVGTGDLPSRIQAFDRAVRRQLESEEYALAHFTDPVGGYGLCERRADYGHKLIYEAHAFPSHELPARVPAHAGDRRFLNKLRRQELFCLMNADAVVTGSEVTRAYIHDLGVPQENVRIMRAPVDLGTYRPESVGAPTGDPMRVTYLGGGFAWQNLPALLEATKLACREVKLFVTLVGPKTPEQQALLNEKIAELKLEDVVKLEDELLPDEVFTAVASSDLGVLPLAAVDRNLAQGSPLAAVAEFFAAGRPVLVSDLPVARELVPDDAGVRVPPDDGAALARELVRLGKAPELRQALGRRARVLAEEQHDAVRIRRQLLDLYSSLMGGGVRPEARASPAETAAPTMIGTGSGKPRKRRGEGKTDPAIKVEKRPVETHTEPAAAAPLPDASAVAAVVRAAPDPTPITDRAALEAQRRGPITEPFVLPRSVTVEEEPTHRAEPVIGRPPPDVTPPDATVDALIEAEPVGEMLTGGSPEGAKRPPPLPSPPPSLGRPATKKLPPIGGGRKPAAEEPPEISADEVLDADDEVQEVDEAEPVDDAEPVDEEQAPMSDSFVICAIDPWYAQLVHGYCPPEGASFARHTPPTNFPGREQAVPTQAAPAPTLRPKAEK